MIMSYQELVVFPFLNQKMDFSREEEQHKVIHDTLEKLLAIIQSAKEKPAQFKPDEMRELMVNFKEPLVCRLLLKGQRPLTSACYRSSTWTRRLSIFRPTNCERLNSRKVKSRR